MQLPPTLALPPKIFWTSGFVIPEDTWGEGISRDSTTNSPICSTTSSSISWSSMSSFACYSLVFGSVMSAFSKDLLLFFEDVRFSFKGQRPWLEVAVLSLEGLASSPRGSSLYAPEGPHLGVRRSSSATASSSTKDAVSSKMATLLFELFDTITLTLYLLLL